MSNTDKYLRDITRELKGIRKEVTKAKRNSYY